MGKITTNKVKIMVIAVLDNSNYYHSI